ncbi:hypothetical protein HDU93_002113, partial [Gonapodya sp. JEL0774]
MRNLFYDDDDYPTETSESQLDTEDTVNSYLSPFRTNPALFSSVLLNRDAHTAYLKRGFARLKAGFVSLDASRAWICYWVVNSLDLMGVALSLEESRSTHAQDLSRIIATLATFQSPDGGFAGGPQQTPHILPTYASVHTLAALGSDEALKIIDR